MSLKLLKTRLGRPRPPGPLAASWVLDLVLWLLLLVLLSLLFPKQILTVRYPSPSLALVPRGLQMCVHREDGTLTANPRDLASWGGPPPGGNVQGQ